jgi:voltage-gated potassium channel
VAFEAIYRLLTDEESVGTDAVRVQQGAVRDSLGVGEIDFLAYRLILFGVVSVATRVSDSAPYFYTLRAQRFFFNPGPEFRLKANDLLIVFGHEHSVIHFKESCSRKGM